ncbi:MAG: hypothetical protein LBT40_02360 [Deltaproteobacteria bacterium]|jgi:hypothetical protein|nr:hypothetical protein [Deltaproteobacteria bacterium]
MIPLAVSLSRLSPEARGRVGGWARRSQRDVLVVDMPLMAAAGAAEPESRTARHAWVTRAAGAYGSLAPFGLDVPGRGAGRLVRDALAARLAGQGGVARVEGPAGSGKSALLRHVLDSPSGGGGAGGRRPGSGTGNDWACLMDWEEDMDPSDVARLGPLETVMRQAAETLDIPGWNYDAGASANLDRIGRLTRPGRAGRAGRFGRHELPGTLTVMVDSADGMVDALLGHPADLRLLRRMAAGEAGPARLVMAGRRVSRRLERHPSSPFAFLAPPVRTEWPGPAVMLEAVTEPLAAAGWTFAEPALPYRALAAAFWNPGAASELTRAMLIEAARDLARDAPPPHVIRASHLERALSSPSVLARLEGAGPVGPDPLERACALAHAFPGAGGRSMGARGADLPAVLSILRSSWPEVFLDADEDVAGVLAGALESSWTLSRTSEGSRFRSAARARCLGDGSAVRESLASLRDLGDTGDDGF